MKIFNEALSVFNKFFPSIPSKKRSRSGCISGDRSTALVASERSFLGPTISKMGIQNHGTSGSLEFEPETSEEQPKNAVPNKRTRTSLVDTRVCTFNSAAPAFIPLSRRQFHLFHLVYVTVTLSFSFSSPEFF